ncbi:MAG: hypothetical protein KGQ28_08115, partial [Hyphomicrobiales bacterium]|nr:hypothetical protein [Hyphomicrobiales bacterium]
MTDEADERATVARKLRVALAALTALAAAAGALALGPLGMAPGQVRAVVAGSALFGLLAIGLSAATVSRR